MQSIEIAVLNEKNLDLLTVCRPVNDNADIDVAILRALLKKQSTDYQTQLKLSISWNRVDIARKFIFTDENIDKVGFFIQQILGMNLKIIKKLTKIDRFTR